jgi:hypothetical protein
MREMGWLNESLRLLVLVNVGKGGKNGTGIRVICLRNKGMSERGGGRMWPDNPRQDPA